MKVCYVSMSMFHILLCDNCTIPTTITIILYIIIRNALVCLYCLYMLVYLASFHQVQRKRHPFAMFPWGIQETHNHIIIMD